MDARTGGANALTRIGKIVSLRALCKQALARSSAHYAVKLATAARLISLKVLSDVLEIAYFLLRPLGTGQRQFIRLHHLLASLRAAQTYL